MWPTWWATPLRAIEHVGDRAAPANLALGRRQSECPLDAPQILQLERALRSGGNIEDQQLEDSAMWDELSTLECQFESAEW